MDSDDFPFYIGEVYHQFHDDFMPGGYYEQEYNDLQDVKLDDGTIYPTGCPDSFPYFSVIISPNLLWEYGKWAIS